MFNFRLINTPDGNQIIDCTLKTPYNSLTPLQMVEYMEIDSKIVVMERAKREEKKKMERKQKLARNPLYKLACICG